MRGTVHVIMSKQNFWLINRKNSQYPSSVFGPILWLAVHIHSHVSACPLSDSKTFFFSFTHILLACNYQNVYVNVWCVCFLGWFLCHFWWEVSQICHMVEIFYECSLRRGCVCLCVCMRGRQSKTCGHNFSTTMMVGVRERASLTFILHSCFFFPQTAV